MLVAPRMFAITFLAGHGNVILKLINADEFLADADTENGIARSVRQAIERRARH
jgi:hypothetical protein